MGDEFPQGASGDGVPVQVLILSGMRMFRDRLAMALGGRGQIRVAEVCSTLAGALHAIDRQKADTLLLDAGFEGGLNAAAQLRQAAPEVKTVVVGVAETETVILAWAEAGVIGYIPASASTRELPELLVRIHCGEQPCPSRIAACLLRRIAGQTSQEPLDEAFGALTPRERVILRHVGAGLSNKDIARRLDISVGTAKSHVHNIFGKLNLRSRAQVAARLSPSTLV